MRKRLFLFSVVMAGLLAGLSSLSLSVSASEKSLRVLCTTFPIYQITRNVAQGRSAVHVDLMVPAQLGCPWTSTFSRTLALTGLMWI